MKSYFYYTTAIGPLVIGEEDGYITRIKFSAPSDMPCGETPLIKKAHAQIEEYLRGERTAFDLPLRAEGTSFQKKVWDVLASIPYGEVRTYGQVAAQAGNPKACRAVGMANNRNPLAVVVPCHRVIGANGTLTGYAGGLGVKEKLLDLEKAGATPKKK